MSATARRARSSTSRPGPTSHDVVALRAARAEDAGIGHTGTLDPLATGVLVARSSATPRGWRSSWRPTRRNTSPTVRLGDVDADLRRARGSTTAVRLEPRLRAGSRRAETSNRRSTQFRGTFPQMPPPYSAKKVDGVRAYKKARKQQAVELQPVEVTVPRRSRSLARRTRAGSPPPARRLPAGFYVRSLAHDLGQRLGCGAHLEALRRTRGGRVPPRARP